VSRTAASAATVLAALCQHCGRAQRSAAAKGVPHAHSASSLSSSSCAAREPWLQCWQPAQQTTHGHMVLPTCAAPALSTAPAAPSLAAKRVQHLAPTCADLACLRACLCCRTRVVNKTLSPIFDEEFDVADVDSSSVVTFTFWDKDLVGEDDYLGELKYPLNLEVGGW
jgi:hypothetical protein